MFVSAVGRERLKILITKSIEIVCLSVCLSACLLIMTVSCVKTAELIEILFGVEPDKVEETMNEVGLGTPRKGTGTLRDHTWTCLDLPVVDILNVIR